MEYTRNEIPETHTPVEKLEYRNAPTNVPGRQPTTSAPAPGINRPK